MPFSLPWWASALITFLVRAANDWAAHQRAEQALRDLGAATQANKYIASVPTPSSTPFGKATIYSYTVRMCNPWEWMFPVQYAEPWLDDFEFGSETRRIPPEQAKNSLTR